MCPKFNEVATPTVALIMARVKRRNVKSCKKFDLGPTYKTQFIPLDNKAQGEKLKEEPQGWGKFGLPLLLSLTKKVEI